MKKFMFDEFLNDDQTPIQKIKSRSTPAVCGPFEREVIVKESEVASTKKILQKSGFVFVGKGPAGKGRKKVWFNPRVSL